MCGTKSSTLALNGIWDHQVVVLEQSAKQPEDVYAPALSNSLPPRHPLSLKLTEVPLLLKEVPLSTFVSVGSVSKRSCWAVEKQRERPKTQKTLQKRPRQGPWNVAVSGHGTADDAAPVCC